MAAVVPEPPLAVGTLSGAAGARPAPTHLSQMWDRTDLRRLRTPAHVARICHLHISRLGTPSDRPTRLGDARAKLRCATTMSLVRWGRQSF